MNHECVKVLIKTGASVNSPVLRTNPDVLDFADPNSDFSYQSLLPTVFKQWGETHENKTDYLECIKLLVRLGSELDESQPGEIEFVTSQGC